MDHDYDLIYCQIPPNDVTLAVGRSAKRYGIPFVVDVNDLWPEAFRIALDVSGAVRHSRSLRSSAKLVVRTRWRTPWWVRPTSTPRDPFRDRAEDIPKLVVYVGNDLEEFDAGAAENAGSGGKARGRGLGCLRG